MSDLRKQLQATKTEYESLRYPGDLSAEILPAANRGRNQSWLFATAAGIAALMLIGIRLNNLTAVAPTIMVSENTQTAEATSDDATDEQEDVADVSLADMSGPILPQMPGEMELALVLPDFSLSMPSISLAEYDVAQPQEQDQTSTTRESI